MALAKAQNVQILLKMCNNGYGKNVVGHLVSLSTQGLLIMVEIVVQNNGNYQCRNDPNQGNTTVLLCLED